MIIEILYGKAILKKNRYEVTVAAHKVKEDSSFKYTYKNNYVHSNLVHIHRLKSENAWSKETITNNGIA